jgi:VWFA-related protein
MKAHALPFLLAALMLSPVLSAEKRPAIPTLGETIEVSIVDVDVIVTGKDGNRVRGLTRNDFLILENGHPKDISNFAEYTSAGTLLAPSQTRTILVFIERTKLPLYDAEQFMSSIQAALRHTVRRGDAVGLVIWDQARQVRVDFTDDLNRIDFALDAMKRELVGQPRDTNDQISEEVRLAEVLELKKAARMEASEPLTQTSDFTPLVDRMSGMEALTESSRMKRKVNAINAAINSMSTVDGKKVLLLAAEKLGEVFSVDFTYDSSADSLAIDMRKRVHGGDLIESIIRNANAVGVTIYPAYTVAREGRNSTEDVARIARQTGGLEAAGAGGFADLMERFEDDMTDYYSLAYRVEATGLDRKRDISVKTLDPKLVVRSRRSYVEKSDETRMRDRLMAALVRSTTDSMFRIQAELGNSKGQRRSVDKLPLQVRIPIQALTVVPENGTRVGAFSVYVMASAGGHEMSALSQQTRRFEIEPTDTASGHFTYNFDLLVNRKTDRLAVGVLDELSKSYSVLRVAMPERQ